MTSIYDKNTLINKISNMTIYEKDYATIKTLIKYAPIEFVAAAIEEVANGNLYWSDFEKIMPEEYSTLLSTSLENQSKITQEIERLVKFREWTNDKYTNSEREDLLFPIGITNSTDETGKNSKRWEKEYKSERDDLIYALLSVKNDDSTLTLAFKEKLLNAIENGKCLFEGDDVTVNEDGSVTLSEDLISEFKGVSQDKITATAEDGHLTIYRTTNGITEEVAKYLYINPSDILFSVESYVIPVDYRYQVLNETDRAYMIANNCNEDEVKKMKSLLLWIKYIDDVNPSADDSGGNSDA